MKTSQAIIIMLLTILGLSWLSYTITDWGNKQLKSKYVIYILLAMLAVSCWGSTYVIWSQSKQIEQLQEQLQYEEMKYKIIINDPLVRDAMESGG
ncbi:hypothetical protein [Enterococcus sp. DIV0213h]|uniref:hypothetical protein n=1 Tax=Enterococcus sp. DIV0213h TaxID=2774669 RepID=UPI003F230641